MSKLTLDEAIKHCLEVAEDNETKAQKIGVQFLGTTKDKEATDCRECAADYRQLAEWLTELKEAKRLLKAAVEDFTAIAEVNATATPILCPKYYGAYMKAIDVHTRKWRYTDEALKLIQNS